MRLKNKLRRRLLPISSSEILSIGDELTYNSDVVGKIVIDKPHAFGLIKVLDPDIFEFNDKELIANGKKCKILNNI